MLMFRHNNWEAGGGGGEQEEQEKQEQEGEQEEEDSHTRSTKIHNIKLFTFIRALNLSTFLVI